MKHKKDERPHPMLHGHMSEASMKALKEPEGSLMKSKKKKAKKKMSHKKMMK